MRHIYSDVELRKSKGSKALKRILIDTGASLTVLPANVMEQIGGIEVPVEPLQLELGDDKTVKADVLAVAITPRGKEWVNAGRLIQGRKASCSRKDARRSRLQA